MLPARQANPGTLGNELPPKESALHLEREAPCSLFAPSVARPRNHCGTGRGYFSSQANTARERRRVFREARLAAFVHPPRDRPSPKYPSDLRDYLQGARSPLCSLAISTAAGAVCRFSIERYFRLPDAWPSPMLRPEALRLALTESGQRVLSQPSTSDGQSRLC